MTTTFFPIDEYRPATARVVPDGEDAMVSIDTSEGKLTLSLSDHPDCVNAAEVIARAINGLRKPVVALRVQDIVTACAMIVCLPFWLGVMAHCMGVL